MRDGNARRAARRKGSSSLTKREARRRAGPSGNGSTGGATPASRRQRLVVRRFDIRSVLRLSIIFYLSLSCVIMVAALLLWLVATISGVRSNVEEFIGDLVVAEDFRLVGTKMLQLGAVVSVVIVVLGSAANLVMATLYNLISDVVGGLSVVVEGSSVAGGRAEAVDVGEGELVSPRRPARR